MAKMTYKQAGVDVEAGEKLVDWIKTLPAENSQASNVMKGVGGFAGLFQFAAKSYKDPLLVSATDGVGTKLKLAIELEDYDTIGQDLVAMCVNDLICTGADPLFFLDYLSVGKLELPFAKAFLSGLNRACNESDCALIGGETAEMPDLYQDGDFDCAGFAIGVVDKSEVLGKNRVVSGQAILALKSSGFHSNGFSLLRKIFADAPEEMKRELLKPTRLYVKAFQALRSAGGLTALANVTGGGIRNLMRVMSPEVSAELCRWEIPELFLSAQSRAELSRDELLETFNCGVGMYAVVEKESVDSSLTALDAAGYEAFEVGTTISAPRSIKWSD